MFHNMWGWGMWMGWLFGLLVIGLIIWGVKTLASQNRVQSANSAPESALDILKKRYARGEINDQEFEEKRRRLIN